ncbi:hypothetical protein [Nocardioides albus]|uniref:Uncharacterized protein n=1 Tax=Nocardioides albus TaxID=1841 RepID=A0A7W5F7F4_9ACTN|nr:hypothetical protein [Nocardioides albus]MBB3087971.1 hypothetical protein [Nocardioides albus]GGU21670.1 hypothetical protein GCM10007979_20380 [Nocardioides albus]
MVTIAEVLAWKPRVVDSLAEHFYDKRTIVVRLQDEINDAKPPESWVAPSRAVALKAYEEKRLELNDIAAQLSDLALATKEAGKEIKGAQDDLNAVLDEASRGDYQVNQQTGEVLPPKLKKPDPNVPSYHLEADQGRYEDALEDQDAQVKEFVARIERALARADAADVGLARSMADVASGKTGGGDGTLSAAAAAQLPPSLDQMSPEEIAEKFGSEIAIDTIMTYLEGSIPVYKFLTADFEGSAQYRVMQNGEVKMSLKMGAGVGLGVDDGVEASAGVGGFTDFEITFKSKEEAELFLAGLDDAAKDVSWISGRPMPTGLAEYVNEQDVTSKRVGVYVKADIGFETPYVDTHTGARAEGWYDEEKREYGIRVEGSLGVNGGIPEAGTKAGGAFDFSGEVKTNTRGVAQEVSLSGALTGEIANKKLGLDIPGLGSGGGGDVELKMNRDNVKWNEMEEALKSGDMSRAADIAMDHGQVVVRATTVTEADQDAGRVEGGVKQTATQHTLVRPPNMTEFVGVEPETRPAGAGRS